MYDRFSVCIFNQYVIHYQFFILVQYFTVILMYFNVLIKVFVTIKLFVSKYFNSLTLLLSLITSPCIDSFWENSVLFAYPPVSLRNLIQHFCLILTFSFPLRPWALIVLCSILFSPISIRSTHLNHAFHL